MDLSAYDTTATPGSDETWQLVCKRGKNPMSRWRRPTSDINEMVFDVTVAKLKDFAERRLGQGASNEQLNIELENVRSADQCVVTAAADTTQADVVG